MEHYNRARAVEYARRWWNDRNPQYFDYGRFGGDCTNFVSQCLHAGGMPTKDGIYGWNYASANKHSASWTGVEFLYNYLMRAKAAEAVESNKLVSGDVVQLSFDGVTFSHTLLVVEVGISGDIFVAAHNNDAFGRALDSYTYKKIRGLRIVQ